MSSRVVLVYICFGHMLCG